MREPEPDHCGFHCEIEMRWCNALLRCPAQRPLQLSKEDSLRKLHDNCFLPYQVTLRGRLLAFVGFGFRWLCTSFVYKYRLISCVRMESCSSHETFGSVYIIFIVWCTFDFSWCPEIVLPFFHSFFCWSLVLDFSFVCSFQKGLKPGNSPPRKPKGNPTCGFFPEGSQAGSLLHQWPQPVAEAKAKHAASHSA